MEQRLKQRLIGAVVLVALAVIFIPMLLTGPVERHAMDVPIEIPPRPQVMTVPGVPEPMPASDQRQRLPTPVFSERQQLGQAQPATTSSGPAARPSARASVASETTTTRSQGGPASTPPAAPAASPSRAELAAWAVQVGSFGSQLNATGLRDKLRAAGFAAYVDTAEGNGQRFYRVRVGPVIERAEAESLKARLEREQSLPALVVAHP